MPYPSQSFEPTAASYSPWVDLRVARLTTGPLSFQEEGQSDTSLEHSYTAQNSGLTNIKMEPSCYLQHAEFETPRMSMDRRSMDSAYYSSQHSSPWPSSDGVSDSCSGTWSSSAASDSYSPEPHPATYPGAYNSLHHDTAVDAFRPYPVLNAAQTHPDSLPGYYSHAVPSQPYYQQPWGYIPPQAPDTLDPEETTWIGGSFSHPSFDQASEPSPSPPPTPELESSPKRRGRKPSSHPKIKQEPESPRHIEPLSSIQEIPHAPTHVSSTSRASSTPTTTAKSTSFPCPLAIYGCTSSFVSKNEWKRHINTQHLCLETWRCDQCKPSPQRNNNNNNTNNNRTNDFNRKDLFIQHLRRMHCSIPSTSTTDSRTPTATTTESKPLVHPPRKKEISDQALWAAEQRCHIKLRHPPTRCSCLFCDDAKFSGREAWTARTEHIAKHLDEYKKLGMAVPGFEVWRSDRGLEEWLLREKVLVVRGRTLRLRSQIK